VRVAGALLRAVTWAVVGIAVALFGFLAVGPRTGAYQTSTMLTASMAPGIPVGAAIVGVPVPLTDVQPGQVVSLQAPLPGRPVVTHRVVEVVRASGHLGLRTRGDANSAADPYVAYPTADRVWVVKAVLPGLGTLVRDLRAPVVRTLLVVALPALLAGWGLVLLWTPPKGRHCA
jgi:signal peptidase